MKSLRRANLWAMLFALAVVGGCDCDDETLGGVEAGFRVSGQTIDFGRVLIDTRVTREVELISVSRADVQVDVDLEGPFIAPQQILVPAGSSAKLSVTFVAGSSREEGRLLLGPADKKVPVPLVGEGVVPRECVPSAVCKRSVYDLTTDSCVESPANEGDGCLSTNACIENGTCRSGACVGTARTCDDNDLCTVDGCSATTGCVNAQITCPSPNNPCRVPTCDRQTGCGEAFAPDGIICGSVDCVKVQMCISGTCTQVDTPEGFLCAPPTPCQGEGRCSQKQCVRPDAGVMTPEIAASVSGDLVRHDDAPTLLAHNGNLYFEVCNTADGGCELLSYTPTGFLRFNRGHGDDRLRWVQFVSDAGVVVGDGDSLEAFSISNGAPLWKWSAPDASVEARSVVLLGDGGIAAVFREEDGGSALWLFDPKGDAGASVAAYGVASTLAASKSDQLIGWEPNGTLQLLGEGAGSAILATDGGLDVIVLEQGVIFAGAQLLIAADGGVMPIDWSTPSPIREPLTRHVLASQGLAYAVANSCEAPAVPACLPEELQTDVRAISLADGTTRWQAKLHPANVEARDEELAVVNLPGGAVVSVADVSLDGGMQSYLQLVVSGTRVYVCPLPPGGRLQGAVFDRSRLFVVMDRAGVHRLESYDLKGLPLSTTGWPQRNGVGGARRER